MLHQSMEKPPDNLEGLRRLPGGGDFCAKYQRTHRVTDGRETHSRLKEDHVLRPGIQILRRILGTESFSQIAGA